MAELFGVNTQAITRHLGHIYAEGELDKAATCSKMEQVRKEGASIEEKAAMLLYLVVKNHSFVDGNKRIAATLFLWFMQNNGILYRADGTKRISDASLVALTLMIAESHTDEMDTMIKVVVSLINQRN